MPLIRSLPEGATLADLRAKYADLLELFRDDTALVHAIAVCACFNMMNRLVEGAGIVGDAESYALAARRLVEEGYERRA